MIPQINIIKLRKYDKILITIISILLRLSANSLFFLWIGLEVNILAIIPKIGINASIFMIHYVRPAPSVVKTQRNKI
jgi:hypothetical protein